MFWYLNYLIIIINYLILFISKPAKQVISLDVEYAPEVEATEIFVHAATGNIHTQIYISLNRARYNVWWCIKRITISLLNISGNSVELVCNVHAHPTPIVKWFKNKMELTEDVAQVMPEKIDRAKSSANILASWFESLLQLKILIAKRFSNLNNIWRFFQLMLVDLLHKLLMDKWRPAIYNCLIEKYCFVFLNV